jgi:signal peptidase I
MATTAVLVGVFAVIQGAELVARALFLTLGTRWAKIPRVSFLRSLWAVVAAVLIGWPPAMLLSTISTSDVAQEIAIFTLQVACFLGLTWLVMARILGSSLGKAVLAWLPTLIPQIGFVLLAVLVVIPYLFEAFKIPTNAMAPTIIGQHLEAPCPRCGSPAYATPEPEQVALSKEPVLMICSRERRSCEVVDPPRAEHPGDRLVVNKLICPQRWDVIVFRYPENPEVNFVFRLAGLPGETVAIRDGAVWINGEKQTPPDSCKGIEYLARLDDGVLGRPTLWGSEGKPAKLGPDEYFVLGDFSARAKDSRLWQQGAPGHPPYAVPASYIVGVVTHIYWPPSRWRVLR